ncbi:MAG: glycosyl transferase, group 1 [Candidatus Moranbacteria bacterium GW2011_GWE2_35_2-]|nr:MAG: glycosyl transferase, group 1 [Candidatus Moranbacteria bacterium GW2011_GWE2_35_2-]KKQ05229.1 MAG: glycosyl transferase, group 1 [Candidatus Moranbacteria bacterium GW2011_GWF1_36_4]KKQ22756.1 MAG: glycosyl transferase, group 1 [Candidatus Moranbacteria bacterium GW2011_GWF2_37_11]KKQ28910.1 MAG: glycosyl transferase, group 1 [Candidatus Moranbacteria bacterium GW2011_GWD1_37_17]KKQ31013.1 MAG: glycosyl transferase, group 1 [Candidatus Moranbacteria bacterium GW2011_GWE1_37_24]KKQ4807
MKKIGIDARFFGSIGKGLGRYTQKLIENLEKTDAQNEYYIFLRKENFNEYQPRNEKFHKILADYRWYTFSEQINMSRLLKKYNLDLVHFPHFNVPLLYRKKFVITIHDLILVHFPTILGTTLSPFFYWLKFLAYKIVIKSAIERAKRIITVSEFTKNDIENHYPQARGKIRVTYEACEDFCFLASENKERILEKYGIIKPYLMYVGNAYPHKNLDGLVSAFAYLRQENPEINLVLVGKDDYFYRKIKEQVKQKKISGVVFPGFIPDCELDAVYYSSNAYVFPSLYEGFGLPPLEAMAKGVPVVSSDHKCMKEILGDSALFFDGRNRFDMEEKMRTIYMDSKLRIDLVKKGYEQIKKYSWKKMAEKTLKIYEKV